MLVKRAYLNDGTTIGVCIGTDRHIYAIERGPDGARTGWTDLDPGKSGKAGRQFTSVPDVTSNGVEVTIDATAPTGAPGVEDYWSTWENVYRDGKWSGWVNTGGRAAPFLPPPIPR